MRQIGEELTQTANEWFRVYQERSDGSGLHAPMIYRGDPFIVPWLNARKRLNVLLRSHRELEGFREADVFLHKLAGTSLNDIEQMPLPLSTGNIKRINRMFKNRFAGQSQIQSGIRQAMIYLPSQVLVRSDEKNILRGDLGELYRRLVAYFDYHTDFITNFSLEEIKDALFMCMLAWAGPMVIRCLGCYIPVRLGITPSSAVKLYRQRAEVASMPTRTVRKLFSLAERESQEAFSLQGLPGDLAEFQKFDEVKDNEAAELLVSYYRSKNFGDSRLAQESGRQEQLLI